MIKTAMKILGVVIVLLVGVWGALFLTAKPVTEAEAQGIATQEVKRSAEQLRFDASIFRGPELVDVQRWGYAFQWRYSDQEGTVDMLVWVDKYGGAEISWEGDLERLRTRR
jgi:hypothetical protein